MEPFLVTIAREVSQNPDGTIEVRGGWDRVLRIEVPDDLVGDQFNVNIDRTFAVALDVVDPDEMGTDVTFRVTITDKHGLKVNETEDETKTVEGDSWPQPLVLVQSP